MKIDKVTLQELRELAGVYQDEGRYIFSLIEKSRVLVSEPEVFLAGILPDGETWAIWFSSPDRSSFFRLSRRLVKEAKQAGIRTLHGQGLTSLNSPLQKRGKEFFSIFYTWNINLYKRRYYEFSK